MLAVKRLEEIAKILQKNGSVDAYFLREHLRVTSKTVRKDLDKLEAIGLLERVYGGAILKNACNGAFPAPCRKEKNLDRKEQIGQYALKYIEDGEIFIFDGGSTIQQMAKHLGDSNITMITNDLRVAGEVLDKEKVMLHIIGGKYSRENGACSLLGRDAERGFEKYHAKRLFLGTTAIDFDRGLMVLLLEEAEMKKAMISSAQEVICLADYSKFHKSAFVSFCSFDDIDILITDDRITEEDKKFLEAKGIKVEIAAL